jgi:hypothetical protein
MLPLIETPNLVKRSLKTNNCSTSTKGHYFKVN